MTLRRIPVIGGLLALGSLLLAFGWVALAPIAPLAPAAREMLYVIPKGATPRGVGSDGQFGLPSHIRLTLGIRDILVLRNESEAEQQLGPVRLSPGQTYRIPFHQPSVLQLACSFHQGTNFLIFVDPPPSPGWERLRWRLGLTSK